MWNLIFYLAMLRDATEQTKFEQLYWNYRDLMLYQARKILDDYLAEDAVNEAFLRIAQNITKVEAAVSPRTKALLICIVENIVIDMYRKRKREQGYGTDLSQAETVCALEQDDPWTESRLAEAIFQLPPAYRQVILLKYVHGYGNHTIADFLNYTVANVEKLLSRGKRMLAQQLKKKRAK